MSEETPDKSNVFQKSGQVPSSMSLDTNPCPPKMIIGRWQQLISNLKYSSEDFYQTLEKKFGSGQIPELEISRVAFRQRGILSGKRIYLRLVRNEFIFDICASPLGNKAFYISYWHGFLRFSGSHGILMRLGLMTPILGYFLERHLKPDTYHHVDSADMFQQLAHNIILETVDEITSEASLPPLSEEDRKPVQKNLLNI